MTSKRLSKPVDGVDKRRKDHEPPAAVAQRGWRYHHLGIPTAVPRPGEIYLEPLRMYVSGFRTSPYGVEWMRFEPDCPVPELVRKVPHLAFEVDNLDAALEGKTLIGGVSSPAAGIRVAMIVDDGAPIELLEFRKKRSRTARSANSVSPDMASCAPHVRP
ncbi:MAG TPA: hypothetical protein VLW52_09630 [Opitutaceae bacterium]|nr:hypothetical protein [Opitutaceae bacterium]